MDKIPFFRPSIGEEEIEAVKEVMKSGHLTLGQKVKEFEEKFSEYVGHPYCVATNSLTNGYLLVLDYLKPKWVDMPSMTFVSMANIPRLLGIKIAFRDEICMGRAYDIMTDELTIVDSAHHLERNLCKNNVMFWLFSFYANKLMTTGGEGGMIVCPNEESYKHFMEVRDCGLIHGKYSWDYTVEKPGWYTYMTDFNAAMGIVQLERLDTMNLARKALVLDYNKLLGEKNTSLHLYTIAVDERDKFIEYMKENNVQVSVHYKPIHLQPAYANCKAVLPKTETIAKLIVSLPLYPDLKLSELRYICDLVNEWRGK